MGTVNDAPPAVLVRRCGIWDVTITSTTHAADGLYSAIVQARKPAVCRSEASAG